METLAFFPPAKRAVGIPVTKGGHGIRSESGVSYPNQTTEPEPCSQAGTCPISPGGVAGGEKGGGTGGAGGSGMGGGDTKSQDTVITSPPSIPHQVIWRCLLPEQ